MGGSGSDKSRRLPSPLQPTPRKEKIPLVPVLETTGAAKKRDPSGRRRTRLAALYFALKFVGLLGLYYALILIPFFDRMLYGYLAANAWLSSAGLNLLGEHTRLSDVTIQSGAYFISVRRGCDGIEPAWFFCAALIAFPTPFKSKWAAMLLGSALILALNLLRIISLYLIGLHLPAFFGPAHLEVWPATFIVLVIGLWALWVRGLGFAGRPKIDVAR
jgi:exosortase/archaeosortase family protein